MALHLSLAEGYLGQNLSGPAVSLSLLPLIYPLPPSFSPLPSFILSSSASLASFLSRPDCEPYKLPHIVVLDASETEPRACHKTREAWLSPYPCTHVLDTARPLLSRGGAAFVKLSRPFSNERARSSGPVIFAQRGDGNQLIIGRRRRRLRTVGELVCWTFAGLNRCMEKRRVKK